MLTSPLFAATHARRCRGDLLPMAIIAAVILTIAVGISAWVIGGATKSANGNLSAGADQWALANARARLQAATMYDSAAITALASAKNQTWTMTEPTPPPGMTRYAKDPASITFTVGNASAASLTLDYGSLSAAVSLQQRVPSCNTILTSIGDCAAH